MLATVRHLLELIRFSHTIFALPFAMLSAVMAWTTPICAPGPSPAATLSAKLAPECYVGFHWQHLLGILICMVGARSAAMAFNRVADRKLDAENPRTRARHLPAGLLSVASVAGFTVLSALIFLGGTLLFLPNWLPLALALPVLSFLLGYSYAKRFTSLAHFWLGAALMLAPVSAWIALRGEQVLASPADLIPPAVLGLGVLLWVSGFDIIYACQDAAFDRQARLRSVPARLGVPGALRLAAALHLATVLVLAVLPLIGRWAGPVLGLGWIYGSGIAAVAALLAYEHSLVRADDLTRVNVAFFHVNAVVSLGLFLVGTLDLLY